MGRDRMPEIQGHRQLQGGLKVTRLEFVNGVAWIWEGLRCSQLLRSDTHSLSFNSGESEASLRRTCTYAWRSEQEGQQ